MENVDWKLYEDGSDDYSCVKLLVDIITPQILKEILEKAYIKNISFVAIDAGFELNKGDGIYLANNWTYRDEIIVIEKEFRNLGVGFGYFF